MSEREILEFAVIGIDTEILKAADELKADREINNNCAVWIGELSDKRREIGAKLKAMGAEITD